MIGPVHIGLKNQDITNWVVGKVLSIFDPDISKMSTFPVTRFRWPTIILFQFSPLKFCTKKYAVSSFSISVF